MPEKCPTCGRESHEAPASNREREIVLRVPERDWPLFRKTFREMEVKLGMHGYGELANGLRPYGSLFREDSEIFRYFDDGALATAMTGVTRGYPASVRIERGARQGHSGELRISVHVDFTFPDGAVKALRVAEAATEAAAERFRDWFDEAAERLRPMADSPEQKT
jgi:hypothetical protein